MIWKKQPVGSKLEALNSNVINLGKANANYITVTSLADMKSKLIAVSNTPSENNTVIEVGIAVSYSSAEIPGWQSYYGQLNVIIKGSEFNGTFTSENGNQLTLSLSNGTWTIYSLNSNMTNITQLTASYSSDLSLSTSSRIYAYKYMKMLLVTGYINTNSNISANRHIAVVSGVNILQEVFISPISSGGGQARIKLTNSGQDTLVYVESPLTSGQWYSFSFVAFLS